MSTHDSIARRVTRWSTPGFLGLALLVFLLPFVSVSCDTPGGFGRATQGGTTTYSGFDLATGTAPSVDADHIRPDGEQESDSIGVQPAMTVGALLLVVGLALCFMDDRRRRFAAAAAAAAALCLLLGTFLARSAIVDRVSTTRSTPLPPGKSAGDYVGIQIGAWLAIVFALLATASQLISNRRPRNEVDHSAEHPR